MLFQLLSKHIPTPPAAWVWEERRGKRKVFLEWTFDSGARGSGDGDSEAGKPRGEDRTETGCPQPLCPPGQLLALLCVREDNSWRSSIP